MNGKGTKWKHAGSEKCRGGKRREWKIRRGKGEAMENGGNRKCREGKRRAGNARNGKIKRNKIDF